MNKNQRIKIAVIFLLALSIAVGGFYLSSFNSEENKESDIIPENTTLEPTVETTEGNKQENIQEEIVDTNTEENKETVPVIENVETTQEEVVPEIEENIPKIENVEVTQEEEEEPTPVEEEPQVEEDPERFIEETTQYTYDGEYINLQIMDYNYLREPGWLISYDDGEYASIIGIDISEYSGNVDFYKLKDLGIDFVMLRVGWRGSTEGGIYEDNYFEAYYNEAVDAGLNIGYYFFSQAISDEEAIEEANFVLDKIADKRCDMFVTFDMELPSNDCRIAHMSSSELTSAAQSFCSTIESAGLDPMIYTNYDWSKNYYYISELSDIPIWYAQYNGYPNLSFEYVMWQYTDRASLGAIQAKGHTDLNLMLVRK